MNADEAIRLLRRGATGVEEWNYMRSNDVPVPSLAGVDLEHVCLDHFNLSGICLNKANISESTLHQADFFQADLRGANFHYANLSEANLSSTNLNRANLRGACLRDAILRYAKLRKADLTMTDFTRTVLHLADISFSKCSYTSFCGTNILGVTGLETVLHFGPSYIDHNTLLNPDALLPEIFLRGCGVSESLINYLPSIINSLLPVQFYSCFISFSHKDEGFAQRLHARLREIGLRVWFAPEDVKGGTKLYDQIDNAIKIHDKLLLVLSSNSMDSEWVKTEIRNARRSEIREKKRKIFPIRLVSFDQIAQWECFDADTGKDLAIEIREYFIPDFTNWKDPASFESAFSRLARDLKDLDSPS